jgi:sulfite reductase (ferredoxin)
MQTESANRADIAELSRRIADYRQGREDEDRFKHYRLTRGVYGQRQPGVHMFRTKIPYGKISPDQLVTLADISERYTNGRLHLTTRQNVQLHYVKLADSPTIWEELVAAGMTAREACGNTVRNITASPLAGVDPEEPFDVSPYVQATFEYFLRNPICQEMGRKIKPAFSSSERDSAFTYFHDFGFIPRMREGVRGFKVVVGGGLGAVSMVAQTAFEFLPADQILPFQEAALRVFDRYGEREKRMKARMKFLIKQLGFDRFLELVHEEWAALEHQRIAIPTPDYPPATGFWVPSDTFANFAPASAPTYVDWLKTNVRGQKQAGYHSVAVRVPLGNLEAEQTRLLAGIIRTYASDDVRLSVQQGMILRFVPPTALPHLFTALNSIGLGSAGYDTTADITACPGTDTCALGVTNSTGLARVLETLVRDEYPELVTDDAIRIKISGCMNACGQHMAANVGFHGSSIRLGERIAPAMQVVVGGGIAPDGRGFIAQKVIKLPTKRIPEAVRRLFDDYRERATEGEYYNDYALRQGKRYF